MELQFLVTLNVDQRCEQNKELVAWEILNALKKGLLDVVVVKPYQKPDPDAGLSESARLNGQGAIDSLGL